MDNPLRLGIAGLGTVGGGLIKIVQQQAETLASRAGREIVITAVSARDQNKARGVNLSTYVWVDDARDLATRDDVDVVVELVGGSEGVAKELVEAALKNG
ncbi:MAG: homoserine dehydrogenase, partial [Rhodospirillales bacterium CG15_BIG_FIL_POST_REV_8_21_14_020_66_15]